KEYTAGEYKRTVSIFGEITPKGEEKFREQLEATHQLFKGWVKANRPVVDIDRVATGEYWFGQQALELKLVDELRTSDDYLMSQADTNQIIRVSFEKKQKFSEKLSGIVGKAAESSFLSIYEKLERKKFL
ncbi:MAG: protease SohB, partial [Proteobacteria bacterium]